MNPAEIPHRDQENLVIGETAIASLGEGLFYRGYAIEELVQESSFIEVAFLIVQGDLPSQEQLADMQAVLAESAVLENDISSWIERLPLNVPAIDVLRTGVCLLGLSEAYEEELTPSDVWDTLQRLMAQLPLIIAARHRNSRRLAPVQYRDDLSYAGNLIWYLTDSEPSTEA